MLLGCIGCVAVVSISVRGVGFWVRLPLFGCGGWFNCVVVGCCFDVGLCSSFAFALLVVLICQVSSVLLLGCV